MLPAPGHRGRPFAPRSRKINAIRGKTVTIGVGSTSKDVNVWAMICKLSSAASVLDTGMTDWLTLVVDDQSQKLLNSLCQQYETSRSHFEQALACVRHDPSGKNFAELTNAASQFRNSVATVDSQLAMLADKIAGIHSAFVTSRDLLANIQYGPVRESAHSLATHLDRLIDVTEAVSGQVARHRAGLEEAIKTLEVIAQKVS